MPNAALRKGQSERVTAGLPFVEALARRVAASMPNTIDVGDLVQDGVIGLIDAVGRYDAGRGVKFETFAERRVRGAMIDALRRDAWPRGVRRIRRELESAREQLRRELGHEPSLAELARRVGSDETRLGRTIVRINTIESTSPLSAADNLSEALLPAVLVPSEPERPEEAYERVETQDRVRAAIASLPIRERRIIALYYYGDVTMKEIGASIGVNESRVSQLHGRAIQRLRKALGAEAVQPRAQGGDNLTLFATRAAHKPQMAKAHLATEAVGDSAVVLRYPNTSRMVRNTSVGLNALAGQRQALSAIKRVASGSRTSPMTKIVRCTNPGEVSAIAR
jgi:RNA polymerase sigma factor for flagellar operon FliA